MKVKSLSREMHIYVYIKSASSALNKRARQQLTTCAAFPEKLRGLLGSGPGAGGRAALCRHCAGRLSAHVVQLLGHLCAGLRFRPRSSRDSAVGWQAMELGVSSQLWLWLLLLLLSPVPGREKESGVLRTGPGPPMGLGVWPRCRRRSRAVAAAAQSWAAGTAALRSRVPLGVRRCFSCPEPWRVTHPPEFRAIVGRGGHAHSGYGPRLATLHLPKTHWGIIRVCVCVCVCVCSVRSPLCVCVVFLLRDNSCVCVCM